MPDLGGYRPADTYPYLLQLPSGVPASGLRRAEDGAGRATALWVGASGVSVSGTLAADTLPAPPTADGVYALVLTVAAGVPSAAWVSTFTPSLDFSDPRNSMYIGAGLI